MPRRGNKPLVHGKRSTYVRGCRCDECKVANTEYTKDLAQRKRLGQPVLVPLRPVNANPDARAAVQPSNAPDPDDGPGLVESQVIAEIEQLTPKVQKSHIGLIASAKAMARIIGIRSAVWWTAARKFR